MYLSQQQRDKWMNAIAIPVHTCTDTPVTAKLFKLPRGRNYFCLHLTNCTVHKRGFKIKIDDRVELCV